MSHAMMFTAQMNDVQRLVAYDRIPAANQMVRICRRSLTPFARLAFGLLCDGPVAFG